MDKNKYNKYKDQARTYWLHNNDKTTPLGAIREHMLASNTEYSNTVLIEMMLSEYFPVLAELVLFIKYVIPGRFYSQKDVDSANKKLLEKIRTKINSKWQMYRLKKGLWQIASVSYVSFNKEKQGQPEKNNKRVQRFNGMMKIFLEQVIDELE